MSTPEQEAVDLVCQLVQEQGDVRAFHVAVQWPTMAAALARLLAARGEPVPPPFRQAERVVAGEPPSGYLALPSAERLRERQW